MEMQILWFFEGRALQAAEMPAVSGKGRVRKGRIRIPICIAYWDYLYFVIIE
jgi:hypothetical protein